nr:MAG: hypothetical protein [Ips tombus-like virus 1]
MALNVLNAQIRDTIIQNVAELVELREAIPQQPEAQRWVLENQVHLLIQQIARNVATYNWRQDLINRVTAVEQIVATLRQEPVEPQPRDPLADLLNPPEDGDQQPNIAEAVADLQQLAIDTALVYVHPERRVDIEEDDGMEDGGYAPDFEQLFAEVHEVAVGPDEAVPGLGREQDIGVGPEADKECDYYLSNKGIGGRLPEDIASRPMFEPDLGEADSAGLSWIAPYFSKSNDLVDQDLLEHLRVECMFMPRTPALLILLREKAKRFVGYYDTTGVRRREMRVVIGKTVLAAYYPSPEEVNAVHSMMNLGNKIRLWRHNQYFSKSQECQPPTPGQSSSRRTQSVVKGSHLKILVVGLGSLIALRATAMVVLRST